MHVARTRLARERVPGSRLILRFPSRENCFSSSFVNVLISARAAGSIRLRNSRIYRTGSDEFVVALHTDKKTGDILGDAQEAYQRLTSTQQVPSVGKTNFSYKAAVARKIGPINTSVITVLKSMLNKDPDSENGSINFTDIGS